MIQMDKKRSRYLTYVVIVVLLILTYVEFKYGVRARRFSDSFLFNFLLPFVFYLKTKDNYELCIKTVPDKMKTNKVQYIIIAVSVLLGLLVGIRKNGYINMMGGTFLITSAYYFLYYHLVLKKAVK